jgi:hypothetical protein
MPALAGLAAGVISEEQARRRPVAVRIAAEPVPVMSAPDEPVAAAALTADEPAPARESEPSVPLRLNAAHAAV